MRNKKSIMAFSGLFILCFHLWVNIGVFGAGEMFIKQTMSVGVDMFFFLSAYSLAGRDYSDYFGFLKNRFFSVYLKFVLLAVWAGIRNSWKVALFLRVISGIDFLTTGGGSFLWFLPAIMIFYILLPLYQKLEKKNTWLTLGGSVLIWCVLAWVATGIKPLYPLFIWWNRIPVFLLGYYCARYNLVSKICGNKLLQLISALGLVIVGGIIVYHYGYMPRLQVPFRDMFYVVYIPICVGLVLFIDMVPECRVIRWIGASTLELYGAQMIVGYSIANRVLRATDNKLLTNASVILCILILAIVIRIIYDYLLNLMIKNLRRIDNEQSI